MIIIMKQNMLNHITRKVILLTLFLFAATTAVVAESYTEEDLKNEVSAGEFWVFRKEVSQKLDAGDNNIPRGGCFIISIYNRYGTDKVWCYETDSEGVEPRSSTYSGVIELDVFLDALNSGKVVVIKKGRTAPTPLTEEERTSLIDLMKKLMAWLKGNGDPLGLGKHTGPLESAVINVIGIIAASLLGNAIVGVTGGGGAGLAESLIGGLTGGTPPPVPPTQQTPPDLPNLPKRKDDEDDDEVEVAPGTDNDGGFRPTHYPDLCNKYLSGNPDGTLTMTDPVTGKPLTYYPTPDGKGWESESGTRYSNESLEENLRFRHENAATLKQDAAQAAKNADEQHRQWESDVARQQREGSDMVKYLQEQEAARAAKEAQLAAEERKQAYMERLAEKYGVTTNDKVLKNALKMEQQIAEMEHKDHMAWDKELASSEAIVGAVDKTAELAVNTLGEFVPGGRVVKNVYTFTKSVAVNAADATAKGKSGLDFVMALNNGVVDGTLGVIQNQAGDITKNVWVEGTMVVGGEGIRSGYKAITEGKSPDEVLDSMKQSMAMKGMFFGIGKGVQAGLNKMKDASPGFSDAMKPTEMPDDGFLSGNSQITNNRVWQTAEKYIGKTGFNINGGSYDAVEGAAAASQESFASTFNILSERHDERQAAIEQLDQFTKNVKDFSDAAAKYRRT